MRKGFTLMELLAVVLIMGILTSIAVPQYRRSVERSRVAEASQMLPALFDARERLLAENGLSWGFSTSVPTDVTNAVSFSKIDIALKGKQGANKTLWETDAFSYSLMQGKRGSANVTGPRLVSAELKKGAYKGSILFFDGNRLDCCPKAGVADACDRLGITKGSCS